MKRQGKRATQPAAVGARAEAAFGAVEPAASPGRDSFAEGATPRFSVSRKLSATDGPFAETKEGLGGILTASGFMLSPDGGVRWSRARSGACRSSPPMGS